MSNAVPLPDLTAYRLAGVSPAGTTQAQFWTAALTALQATVDDRATALPSTHLWTWDAEVDTGDKVALYGFKPAGSPMTANPGLLLAGDSAAGSAAMQTDASILVDAGHAGIARGATTFTAWDIAAPFPGAYWPGFNRAIPTAANAATTVIVPYVTQESILLDVQVSATAHYLIHFGALIDPHTDGASTSETDGRVYGCFTQGTAVALGSAHLTGAGTFYDHTITTGGAPHGYVLQPRTAGVWTAGRVTRLSNPPSTDGGADASGAPVLYPIMIGRSTASNVQLGTPIGRLREVYVVNALKLAQTQIANGSILEYHLIGYDTGNASQCIAIKAAP